MRDLRRRIMDPVMRYLIVTARAAETRQGLGGGKRNRAGSRQGRETPGSDIARRPPRSKDASQCGGNSGFARRSTNGRQRASGMGRK